MIKRIIFLGSIVILGIIGTIFAIHQNAQQTVNGLSITPYSLDLTIHPGETVSKTISLTNFTNKTVSISINKRNFTAKGEEGQIELTNDNTSYALASWISVSPEKAVIESKQKKDFIITITAPSNAEPGGHFGSVVFATVPDQRVNSTGALLSQEIAALILTRIPGNVNEQAKIVSFTPEHSFYETGPITFTIRIKNMGNTHIKPEGNIVVKNMFGITSSTPVEEKNVLPGAIRKTLGTLNKQFLIGKYTATVTLSYGTQNNALLTATTIFWAFPIKLGVGGLILLIALFVLRKRLFRALKVIITGK